VWKPAVGDVIEGVVLDIQETHGHFGVYPLVSLRCVDGRVRNVHASRAVLRRELHDQRVKVGDTVGIKFLGAVPGKNWMRYRILVEHAAAPGEEQNVSPGQARAS